MMAASKQRAPSPGKSVAVKAAWLLNAAAGAAAEEEEEAAAAPRLLPSRDPAWRSMAPGERICAKCASAAMLCIFCRTAVVGEGEEELFIRRRRRGRQR